jgi:type IV pilus assembly protein PilV
MNVKKFFITTDKSSSRGFTLIEVMIALAIFAVGFLAVGSMQIAAINTNAHSRFSTTLIYIAKDRAEELMALAYDDARLDGAAVPGLNHAPASDADWIDNDEDGQIDEAGESGHITIKWTVIDDTPLPGAKSVRVTATRNAGRRRFASFDFIKANM